MTVSLFLKACAIWIIIAILAMANGVFRESIMVPGIGERVALPASGIILSVVVYVVTYACFGIIGMRTIRTYLFIGTQWVSMTLIFEVLIGYYVAGRTWPDILQVFNIMQGDMFVLVLVASLVSPLLVARVKGLL